MSSHLLQTSGLLEKRARERGGAGGEVERGKGEWIVDPKQGRLAVFEEEHF